MSVKGQSRHMDRRQATSSLPPLRTSSSATGRPRRVRPGRRTCRTILKIRNISCVVGQISATSSPNPARAEGRWPSSQTWAGMRWTRQRRRALVSQGESLVSDQPARETNGTDAYGKSVWFWHPLLMSSLAEMLRARPGHAGSSIREATVTKRNSSPGRARHKP
jgi:hypothetical protein